MQKGLQTSGSGFYWSSAGVDFDLMLFAPSGVCILAKQIIKKMKKKVYYSGHGGEILTPFDFQTFVCINIPKHNISHNAP